MAKPRRTAALFLLALLGAFSLGVYALFALRFETGDVFPAYSSLRADPLGVKALYQALERIPGISVQRHYRQLSKLAPTGDTALFILGLKPLFLSDTPKGMVAQMETLARGGTRLVLSFQSGQTKPARVKRTKRLKKDRAAESQSGNGGYQDAGIGKKGARTSKSAPQGEAPQPDSGVREMGNGSREQHAPAAEIRRAADQWEVTAAYAKVPQGVKPGSASALLRDTAEELPPAVASHTALYFHTRGSAWRVVYAVGEQPVVIERPMGAGSIVLVADSYLFSNEAMRNERHPGLLAWLVGKGRVVVFDEFHLGVSENPGVMTLVRRFRLHGFLAALVLLAGLFVWRDAVPLVPNRIERSPEQAESAAGRDQLQGLINLLRRNLKPRDLLPTCFEEWRKSLVRNGRGMQDKVRRIRELMESRHDKSIRALDAVTLYRQIARILAERN